MHDFATNMTVLLTCQLSVNVVTSGNSSLIDIKNLHFGQTSLDNHEKYFAWQLFLVSDFTCFSNAYNKFQ